VVTVLFVGTLTHSTLGFGTALVAMPLLALMVGVRTATPLVAFVVLTTVAVIAWRTRRSIDLGAAWRLLVASAVGIPVGLWLLKTAPEAWVKGVLGLLLVLFSLYRLLRPTLRTLERGSWVYVFGFWSGLFGGAYNTNGPPVVLYGALRRWSPERFRATLQGYFLPADVLIWSGHGLSGLWTERVVGLFLYSLPLVLLAIPLGTWLNRRIPHERFERLLYVILIGLGVLLLL
jgi:uncharacterized membrane protein YfcA